MSGTWRIVLVSTVLPVVEHLAPYLRDLGHAPVAVVSARPSAARPGREAFVTALLAGAPPYLDVLYAKDADAIAPLLRAYEPDLVVCWGFPWRLPVAALEVPGLGCINLHPGKLPRHRGPIPLSWALRDGDTEFGITWHRMDPGLDTGRILAQTTVPILDEETTIEDAGPRLGIAALGLLPHVLERVAAGDPGELQDEAAATWAGRFGEDYATVDFGRTAREVHNQVRAWAMAFGPGPVAQLGSGLVRLTKTSLVEVPAATRVECADGPLWVVGCEPVDT